MGVSVGGQFDVEAALRRHGAIPQTRDRHNDADSIHCRGLQALAPFRFRVIMDRQHKPELNRKDYYGPRTNN